MDPNGAERFWARVDTSGECWVWNGARETNGYGHTSFEKKGVGAHRMAFFFAFGRWPKPLCLHRCGNRACCRPDHLREGTHAENMADMIASGRARGGRKALGIESVRLIYELSNSMPMRELAHIFGVSRSCIKKILRGERYPNFLVPSDPIG